MYVLPICYNQLYFARISIATIQVLSPGKLFAAGEQGGAGARHIFVPMVLG